MFNGITGRKHKKRENLAFKDTEFDNQTQWSGKETSGTR